MIKRILALSLACIVLVSSLGVPASADELYESIWYDLLEYDSVTDTSNFFYYSADYNVVLDLPVTQNLYYIDAVVSASVAPVVNSIVNSTSTSLTVKRVGTSKLYRIFGPLGSGNYSKLILQFVGSGSTNYCTLLSCKVSSSPVFNYPDIGGLWASPSGIGSSVVTPSSASSTVSVTLTQQSDTSQRMLTSFRANIYVYNSYKYDFADLYFTVTAYSIDSIEVHHGNSLVPYDITYLDSDSNPEADDNPDDTYGSLYTPKTFPVLMRLDLRGIDRSSNTAAVIGIRGTYYNGHATNKISLNGYNGYVATNNLNPITVFLNRIWKSLKSGFEGLTAHLTTLFTDLKTHLTTSFTDLKTHLTTAFTDLKVHLSTKFTDLTENLSSWFTTNFTWLERIRNLLNTIALGRSDQWYNADSFENDVATQETQIDDMVDVIETSPTVPIGDVQFQIGQMSGVLSDADHNYFDVLAVIINGNYQITSVLFAAFVFATIGFLLYGKR